MMRVIAGSARRLNLVTPDSKVRPTTDRTKETLFNMIAGEFPGAKILDLFAGSGALGIEALSRGAASCVFCDSYSESIRCIKKNLEHTKLIEKSTVLQYDYVKALEICQKERNKFHVVFLDPPYDQGLERQALEMIHGFGLMEADGIIVVESSLDTVISVEDLTGFNIYKEKRYKTNKFTFIEYRTQGE